MYLGTQRIYTLLNTPLQNWSFLSQRASRPVILSQGKERVTTMYMVRRAHHYMLGGISSNPVLNRILDALVAVELTIFSTHVAAYDTKRINPQCWLMGLGLGLRLAIFVSYTVVSVNHVNHFLEYVIHVNHFLE